MTTLSSSNFQEICRTCLYTKSQTEALEDSNKLFSLYEHAMGDAKDYKIIELLGETVRGLEIHSMDELPKNICEKCINNLVNFYRFQVQCLKSQNILLDIIGRENFIQINMMDNQMNEDIPKMDRNDPLERLVENQMKIEVCEEEIHEQEFLDEKNHRLETKDPYPGILLEEINKHEATSSNSLKAVKSEMEPGRNPSEKFDPEPERSLEQPLEDMTTTVQYDLSNEKILKCPTCEKNFTTNYNLRRHMNSHEKLLFLECSHCQYNTNSKYKFQKHLMKIHNEMMMNDESHFICDECPLGFRNAAALSTHKQSHKQAIDPEDIAKITSSRYSCLQCGLHFDTIHMLTNHKRVHRKGKSKNLDKKGTELKPYVCNFCNKCFQQSCTLKEHVRIHTGEQPYLCPECGKAFRSSSNMSQHLLRHTGILRYECPECPKKFPCQSDLASHKLIHSKIKRHTCDICNSSFGKPYQLKKHLMYHNGEKPYKCEYCEMRFVCGDHMRRHMRTHTGEKPYKCKYCEKAFAQSNDMIKHLRSHVGENVYRCELCPQSFRLASELRVHFSIHKNDDEETKQKNLIALQEEEDKLRLQLAEKGIIVPTALPIVPLDSVNKKTHFPKPQ